MMSVKLSSGHQIPIVGLGTWKSNPGEVKSALKTAIGVGYRHIDCAYIYGNETEVGGAIKEAIEEGLVTREDLFVTSKLWNNRHSPEDVKPALQESLTMLGVDYLDLYLIHYPYAFKSGDALFPADEDKNPLYGDTDYMDTWKAMEACVDEGLVKMIGVSNFNSQQVKRVIDEGRIQPAVNQIEIHPYFSQERLVQFCQDLGVHVVAYSPLGSPDRPWAPTGEPRVVDEPEIIAVAAKYKKTPAQVILRWAIQRGIIVIPKSVNAGRIRDNFQLFDFEMSQEDMAIINSLNKNNRNINITTIVDGKMLHDPTVNVTPSASSFNVRRGATFLEVIRELDLDASYVSM